MIRITATRRNMAHKALTDATDYLRSYRDSDADWKAFYRDVIRDNVGHARTLRLAGIEYPSIP